MINPQYLQLAQQKLSEFARQDDFAAKMELAFGRQIDRSGLTALGQRWQQGNFGELPAIEVLQNGELGTANGAYAAANQTIYLSSTFLATASTEQIVGVLIEEIGHSVDTVLNTVDSIGDEGALFSELVQGNPLSANDIISLQAEDDRALVTINGQQIWIEQNSVTGTAANDTLTGVTNSGDVISGLEGNDNLTGLNGNDTLSGGSGDDTLAGGAGNDTFILESFNGSAFDSDLDVVTDFVQGQDKIDVSGLGISDFNTIFSSLASNDSFNNTVITTYKNNYSASYSYSLKLNGINRNALTASDFTFATTVLNNTISGGVYNDDLFGGLGNNTLQGDAGNDRLFGEAGIDRLVGGSGSDTLIGGAGNDTFVLESFNGSPFDNNLDVVTDFVQGQDKIDVSGLGISNFDTILALTGNDTFNYAVITTQRNSYSDSYGYSLNLTGINRNALTAADFTFATTSSSSTISSSIYNGGTYNNDLFGGLGNNTLQGGAGNDRLFGEAGIDRLVGNSGSDTFTGGTGNDTFVLENFNGSAFDNNLDIVTDFVQGQDKIDVSGLGISNFNTILALTSNDVVNNAVITTHRNSYSDNYGYSLKLNGTNRSTLTASDFIFATTTFSNNQTGTAYNDDLIGGLGSETLLGGAGDDKLFGEAGIDRLVGGIGSDTLTGGAGNDTFVLENFNGSAFANDLDVVTDFVQGQDKIDVSVLGISNFDTILALTSNNASNSAVITTSKNSYSSNYGYSFQLNGINRNALTASDFTFAITTFSNNQTGTGYNDDLFGGLGNDALLGGSGDDRLFGENGDDTLNGGGGKDTLIGGLGNDTYVVQNNLAGGTVIEDAGGTDILQLSASVNTTTGWSKSGTNLLIDLNADAVFNANDLTIRNFFSASDAAGSGFIENLANLSGSAILDQFNTVRNDFNGDKKSDILWRNDNGTTALWQMNGATVVSGNYLTAGLNSTWKVAGTGDFDGDKKSDILWRNDNSTTALWKMDGNTVVSGAYLTPALNSTWKVVGTGDFDGDKKSDILWRNDNGTTALWKMDGATVVSGAYLTPTLNSTWKVAGTGDFDGDGKSDLLWRNDDGTVALWKMDGATVVSGTYLTPTLNSSWQVAGIGDFNGDKKSDLLWRNDNGTVALWQMDGANIVTPNVLAINPGSNYKVAGTGDFNGDKKSDILLRQDTGAVTLWQMDGANIVNSNVLAPTLDNSWKITAPIL